uniref:Uncharacterized protein n=2 Tax=Oryza barthii TaxID=65489 RepID=A0A0D3GVW6_9ORYZ
MNLDYHSILKISLIDKCTAMFQITFYSLISPNFPSIGNSRGVGDVPVDSEAPVVTSSIYQGGFAGPVFEDAHRGRLSRRTARGTL